MKIHLLDSAEPIPERSDLFALCGAEIKRATFAFMWDGTVMGDDWHENLNSLRTCPQCVRRTAHSLDRYLYGIVPGEEALQESV